MFDRPWSKWDPIHREGFGIPQNGGNDLLRSKQGPVGREGCGVPQNEGNGLVLERYGRNGGLVHQEGCGVPQNGTPWDSIHLHRRPPPALHRLLLIHCRPPPASTCGCSSSGSCSASLYRALLLWLLFNHPSTGTPPSSTVNPALHTMGSCSTPPPLQRSLFIPEAASIGFS